MIPGAAHPLLLASQAAADPFAAQVVLYLRGEGTDGSTSIVDEKGNPFTAYGDTKLTTAKKPYGTSSILLDGTGDYAACPSTTALDLATTDWTQEAWIYIDPAHTDGSLWMKALYSNPGGAWSQRGYGLRPVGGFLRAYFDTSSSGASEKYIDSGAFATATWAHVAMVKQGATGRFFVAGTLVGSRNDLVTLPGNAAPFMIGKFNYQLNGSDYPVNANGAIKGMRLTAAARYSDNFNPLSDTYLN